MNVLIYGLKHLKHMLHAKINRQSPSRKDYGYGNFGIGSTDVDFGIGSNDGYKFCKVDMRIKKLQAIHFWQTFHRLSSRIIWLMVLSMMKMVMAVTSLFPCCPPSA